MIETAEARAKRLQKARSRAWYLKNKERHDAQSYARRKTPKYKATARRYRERNKDRRRAYQKQWYVENRDRALAKATDNALKRKYGLTREQRDAMIKAQRGRCPICRSKANKWHVDHCHVTGKVRSILCRYCNPMLGLARDSIKTLRAAVAYLEHHQTKKSQKIKKRADTSAKP